MIRSTPTTIALVAVNARRARILRWHDGEVTQLEILSEVPARHRSTGHVRRNPMVRHGGAGAGDGAVDRSRPVRIHEFVGNVVEELHPDGQVVVVGSGRVADELVRALEEQEHGRPDPRPIALERAGYLTDRQLRARLRAAAGHPAPRRHAPPRPQVGTLRRTVGRASEQEAIDAELEAWEEPA